MIECMPLWALAPSHAAREARAVIARPGSIGKVDGRNFGIVPLVGTLDKSTLVWVRETIYAMAADDSIGAILLHIDSPGGSAAGTADAAMAVAKASARKPVVAFIEDIGASAAYWIASQASTVITNRTGLVGSIGVFVVIGDSSRFWEKMGVDWFVVKSGRFKGGTVEGAKLSAEVLGHLQERVDGLARVFVGDVARGRRLAVDRVREVADGRVFMGAAAQAIGLVDGISTYEEVLADMRRRTLHLTRGPGAAAALDELARFDAAARGFPNISAGEETHWHRSIRERFPELAAEVETHSAENLKLYEPGKRPGVFYGNI